MRTRRLICAIAISFLCALFAIGGARAEDGHEGWLRYAPLDAAAAKNFGSVPHAVRVEGDSVVLRSALEEHHLAIDAEGVGRSDTGRHARKG